MSLLDPMNGPAGDLPTREGVRRVYVVASTPRTGSTLLCRALGETGRIGRPMEYLNPMQLRDWEVRFGSVASRWRHSLLAGPLLAGVGLGWGPERLDAHLARVMALRTGPTGWFGLKLHAHHRRRWFGDRAIEEELGTVTWVRMVRRDRLAQAVSWARALQTHQWATTQPAWRRPRYDPAAIAARIEAIAADEADWDRELAGQPVVTLAYEDVVADLHAAVRSVFRHLGERDDVPPPTPGQARQADDESAAWIERYQAEAGPLR